MNDFTDLSGQTQLVFKDTTTRATYDEKGTPVFCAKDVATVLGYADTVNAIKQHCRGVAFHHPIVDSLGRAQQARFIGSALNAFTIDFDDAFDVTEEQVRVRRSRMVKQIVSAQRKTPQLELGSQKVRSLSNARH